MDPRRLAAALAGLGLGIAASILLGALTPAGATGTFRALYSTFTSASSLMSSLAFFTAILLSAAGLAVAYRAGFITIGAEGQLVAGVLAAYWLLMRLGLGLPAPLMLASSIVAAAAAGALYALAVAFMRTWFLVNETLASLMLNYVAYGVYNYLVSGPWRSGGFTKTEPLPPEYRLSPLTAAAVAVAVALAAEALLRFTRIGVAVDASGAARRAAETYAARYPRVVAIVSAVQGAAAGMAGALYMETAMPTLYSTHGLGYGYIGILAAWLAAASPLAAIPASLLLALLYVMVARLQLAGAQASFAYALQAVLVLSSVALVAWTARRRG